MEISHKGQLLPREGEPALLLQTAQEIDAGDRQMASQMAESTAQPMERVV